MRDLTDLLTTDVICSALRAYRTAERAGRHVPGGEERQRVANHPATCARCGKPFYAKGLCKGHYITELRRRKRAERRTK